MRSNAEFQAGLQGAAEGPVGGVGLCAVCVPSTARGTWQGHWKEMTYTCIEFQSRQS